MTDLLPQLRKVAEVALNQENSFLRQSLGRLLECDRITIHTHETSIRRCPLKDFHRMTCPAQGQVQKMLSRCRGQRIEDLVKENRDMPGQPERPESNVVERRSGELPKCPGACSPVQTFRQSHAFNAASTGALNAIPQLVEVSQHRLRCFVKVLTCLQKFTDSADHL